MHVFIVYKGLFLIDKIMKHYFIRFYYLKRSMKNFIYLAKFIGQPLWKISILMTVEQACFYSLERLVFYREH